MLLRGSQGCGLLPGRQQGSLYRVDGLLKAAACLEFEDCPSADVALSPLERLLAAPRDKALEGQRRESQRERGEGRVDENLLEPFNEQYRATAWLQSPFVLRNRRDHPSPPRAPCLASAECTHSEGRSRSSHSLDSGSSRRPQKPQKNVPAPVCANGLSKAKPSCGTAECPPARWGLLFIFPFRA